MATTDADALSALLGERSDRQLRLHIAASLAAPQLTCPRPESAKNMTFEQYTTALLLGSLSLADTLIELSKENAPGTLKATNV